MLVKTFMEIDTFNQDIWLSGDTKTFLKIYSMYSPAQYHSHYTGYALTCTAIINFKVLNETKQ